MSGSVISLEEVKRHRELCRVKNQRVVVTNGCFDLLHVGHLRYLTEARRFGDFLWVGVNSDASVRELKGPNRPVNSESDRAEILAALKVVDAVSIFQGKRATEFLKAVRPDVYVKGGDYTIDTLDQGEREALIECGAEIRILQLVPGKSTTSTLERIRQ
jgi:rfaE bifunctional protein nucleotidyltransferase chain/domain